MPRRRRRDDAYDDQYDQYDRYDDTDDADDGYYDDGQDDEDEFGEVIVDDDDYGVNLASRKKAGRYRIIGLLFLILSLLSAAGVFMFRQQQMTTNRTQCWTYQSIVEQKVEDYVRTNGLSANPAYIDDVPGVGSVNFQCPSGGAFTWNPVDGTYTCSEHGHYPEAFVTPESEVTGTQQTAIEDDSSS